MLPGAPQARPPLGASPRADRPENAARSAPASIHRRRRRPAPFPPPPAPAAAQEPPPPGAVEVARFKAGFDQARVEEDLEELFRCERKRGAEVGQW